MNPIDTPLLDRYQRLIEITLDLASTLDLDTLLNRIVNAAVDLINAEATSILLYDEASAQLHFEAATNIDEPLRRGILVPVDSSIAGWIITNRKPIIVSNAQQDPRHYGHISKLVAMSTNSLLGVPLITKDKVIGVLESINKRSGIFTEDDQVLLCAFGAQAAVAIENARLFQQSDLIAELVHELRTPLSSLNTAAHLINRPEVSDEQRNRMMAIIQDETFRLSEMATSYLDLARLESGRAQFHKESFVIKEFLEECANIMRSRIQEKGLQLRLVIPEDLPSLSADRNKLKQVILNLLSNAIKYNRPNGGITLESKLEDSEYLFLVTDTGMGILPENLTRLFEKFYRVPGSEQLATGTGLGLSICKHIVEAHSGHIDVQSEVGLGTTFTVHLPTKVKS